jgi:serine/threonine-protein kinase
VPKVLDFGIAKVDTNTSSGAQTQTGMGMGTPGYMPPEQMNAKDAQPSADQFALGVTLYECLTGERPPARHIIAAAFDRPSVLVPELPREIDDVIVRMLQPDPDKRYADLREVVRALAPFADAKTRDHVLAEFHEPPMEAKVPVTPATAPERPLAGAGVSRRRIRRVLAIAAVAAVAAGAVALSVVSSGTRGESPMETAPGPSTQNVAQPDLSAVRVTTAVGGTGAGDVALTRAADVENPPGPRARPQPRAKTTKVSPTRSKETVVPQGQDLNRLLQ